MSLAGLPSYAQAPPPRLSFEVASIKPNTSGSRSSGGGTRPGGRYVATNLQVRDLIGEAYSLQDFQLVDAPEWTSSERFDINATAGRETSDDETKLMLQTLLAERFGFVARRDTRELPIYELVMARPDHRPGPQLTGAAIDCTDPANKNRKAEAAFCGTNINISSNSAVMEAGSIPMSRFATVLAQFVNRIVVDRTGLAGGHNAKMTWTPNPNAETSGPSLFTALQEQLGLKLESARGPVEILRVEKIDRPTPD
jgi:uncharacterized protein (TIGR03435 family)